MKRFTHRLQRSVGWLGVSALLLVCGCGTDVTTSAVAAPSPTLLAGNWLLFGSLPQMTLGAPPSGLAATFDVSGNTVTGSASLQTTCASGVSFGLIYGGLLTGKVAPDGSFSIGPPAAAGELTSLTIQGQVPASAGAAWQGSYTVSAAAQSIIPGSPCVVNQTAAFTATAVGDVTGTYTGTATTSAEGGPSGAATGSAVSAILTLQQGATLYRPPPAQSAYSKGALGGSVQIQGFSCFSKGVTSTTADSEVEGSRINASFLMEDGSTMLLLGSIVHPDAAQLAIDVLHVKGGQCNGVYGFGVNSFVVQR